MQETHRVDVSKKHDFPKASFLVEVSSADGSSTSHIVILSLPQYQQLTEPTITPEELIKQSFYFLLEREPKEAILPSFALPLIGKYFPEYDTFIDKTNK